MKNNQDNTGALSALLRDVDGVDTLETNSLCCVAAGIIAPSSATAEALIPHEKLRRAALADVTLNTLEGLLAQHVEGDKRALSILTYLRNGLLQTDNVGRKIGVDTIQPLFKTGSMTSTAHVVRPYRSKKIQDYEPSVIGKFQQNLIGAPSLQSTKALKDIPHPSFDKWHVRAKGVRRVNSLGKKMLNLLDKTPQLETVSNFLLYLICFFTSRFQSSLPSRNCTRSQNSAYGPNRLNPGRGILFYVDVVVLQHDKECPAQGSYGKKSPNHPNTRNLHPRRNSQPCHNTWHPTIKKLRECLFPYAPSTKEAA